MAKTAISTKKKQNLQSNHDDDYFCTRNVVEEAIRFCGAPQHQCMISGFVILPIELCERQN
jgi:hypothetical protein